MAVITYTAKRNIAKKNYAVTGSDISASATGNTFDSTVNDLSGMLAGEWVYITGFSNAANNGWHQLASDSTTNQIAVAEALTNEVAGATITVQGYYHGYGQSYQLEFKLRQFDDAPNINSSESRSLSQNIIEALYFGETEKDAVSTDLITEADRPYWKEFFASVRARETFTFDADGTIASPGTAINATLDGKETWQRFKTQRNWFAGFTIEVA